jgi:hypothetical protein
LNIPQSTINPLLKLKEYGMLTNLTREGHPPSRPGKEGINQRGNKETKDNPEGAAKLHSGDWSIYP